MPEKASRPARQRQAKLDAKAKIKEQARTIPGQAGSPIVPPDAGLAMPMPVKAPAGAGLAIVDVGKDRLNPTQTKARLNLALGVKNNIAAAAAAKAVVKPAEAPEANEGPDAYPPPPKVGACKSICQITYRYPHACLSLSPWAGPDHAPFKRCPRCDRRSAWALRLCISPRRSWEREALARCEGTPQHAHFLSYACPLTSLSGTCISA